MCLTVANAAALVMSMLELLSVRTESGCVCSSVLVELVLQLVYLLVELEEDHLG